MIYLCFIYYDRKYLYEIFTKRLIIPKNNGYLFLFKLNFNIIFLTDSLKLFSKNSINLAVIDNNR